MAGSVSFTSMMMGLGMAASLFLGCQQLLDQEDKAPTPAGGAASDAPAEMALKLAMKETDACRALHAQVLAADAAGEATVTLQTDFIRHCIEEVKSTDAAGKVVIPADLIPDDRTRCRWLISEIEGGREELVIKFHYYCPAECDTRSLVDSTHHTLICRDPKPDCVDLKARLAAMDPESEEYARLRHFLAEHCGARDTVHIPKDTLVMPACDSLRHRMAALDPASEEYARLKHHFTELCVPKPPIDTLPPRPLPLCDSLRMILSTLDPASGEYARINRQWHEACVEPVPIDPPRDSIFCEGLLARMHGMDPASPDHAMLKEQWTLRCTDHPADPIEPVDPVHAECDAVRKRMESVDPASADYAHLRGLLSEKCGIH